MGDNRRETKAMAVGGKRTQAETDVAMRGITKFATRQMALRP